MAQALAHISNSINAAEIKKFNNNSNSWNNQCHISVRCRCGHALAYGVAIRKYKKRPEFSLKRMHTNQECPLCTNLSHYNSQTSVAVTACAAGENLAVLSHLLIMVHWDRQRHNQRVQKFCSSPH